MELDEHQDDDEPVPDGVGKNDDEDDVNVTAAHDNNHGEKNGVSYDGLSLEGTFPEWMNTPPSTRREEDSEFQGREVRGNRFEDSKWSKKRLASRPS